MLIGERDIGRVVERERSIHGDLGDGGSSAPVHDETGTTDLVELVEQRAGASR